jgi:hypothetical protein
MPRESEASSNPWTHISIEILRVTGSPAFAGDDTAERIKRPKRNAGFDLVANYGGNRPLLWAWVCTCETAFAMSLCRRKPCDTRVFAAVCTALS